MELLESLRWFFAALLVGGVLVWATWRECEHQGVRAYGSALEWGGRVHFRSASFPEEYCR